MKLIFNGILIGLLVFASCKKEECKTNTPHGYNWEIPVTLSPAKDTFNIGDTITISSIFDDMVYEQLQKKKFNLIDYRFYPVTSIRKLDTLSNHYSAFLSDFSYADVIVPNQYNYNLLKDTDGTTVFLGEYNYVDHTYKLEYQLVLKKAGLFVFNHESYVELQYVINRKSQDFVGKCDDSWSVHGMINLNNGASNNLELLNTVPPNIYIEGLLRGVNFHDKGGYIFYVKE